MLLRRKFVMLCATVAAVFTLVPSTTAAAATAPVTTPLEATEVGFAGHGETLHGTVLAPPGTGRRLPGLVLMGGSDWTSRSRLRPEAEAFARGGIVTLIYDKRTVGYSTTRRDYPTLADDALAAVAVLRARPDVDPARVGLFGISEGGWVAPLAAVRSTSVAFVITVGAVGTSPARQSAWYWGNLLRHEGVRGSLLRTFPITATRQVIGAGLFPEASYDPVPVLIRLRRPLLALWSSDDFNHPAAESATIVRQALDRGGNTHYTIRFLPGAGPDLTRATDGGYVSLPGLAPGYPRLVTTWITALATTPPAASVQALPHQDRLTTPLAPLAWYESTGMQLAVLVLLLAAFLGYPLTALARRLRRRRGTPPARRPARLLATTGTITVLGFVCYLGFLTATGARLIGPVPLGRPIPWLLLQLLALITAASTIGTAIGWWQARDVTGHRLRLGVLMAGGALFVPWALYWGLLLP